MMRFQFAGCRFVRRLGLFAILVMTLLGCGHPQRNVELKQIDYNDGYRWTTVNPNHKSQAPLDDTIVIVTASGGGTRAAALTLGVLRALDATRFVVKGQDGRVLEKNFLDEIDVVSSVSGGSVTSAYFALHGSRGFDTLEDNFIRKDGISALLWRGLNPIGLARLSTPSYARIDLLADYLNDALFMDASYQSLLDKGTGSYLILNAADMSQGSVFSFTQPTFDLLCSDLTQIRLADAVAASAAFPVALSPLTLINYSPCRAQEQERSRNRWPPHWIKNATNTEWYTNQTRVRRGRTAEAYLNQGGQKGYVHLLDGGIADNLGIAEPFRLLTTADVSPSFFTDITQGRVKNLVFVMINARSDASSELDTSPQTPGVCCMLSATIDSAIDNATFSSVDHVEVLLRERLKRSAGGTAQLERIKELSTYLIAIDFDAIENRRCRLGFQNIETTWKLNDQQIDGLLQLGGALLEQDQAFGRLRKEGKVRGTTELPPIGTACGSLLGTGL